MKRVSVLIKPVSSLCNMNCTYCFYTDISVHRTVPSYGVMDDAVLDKILNAIFQELTHGDEITFAFQGGEPTLAGLPWFENFINKVDEHNINVKVCYSFQTNGILLDDTWADFFYKNNFLVGISVDGGKSFHNHNRIDSNGQKTWDKVINAIDVLKKNNVEYNILCVLTNEIAKEPEKIWRFIINEQVKYIQFIPCLESIDKKVVSKNKLMPQMFFHFYARIFSLWSIEFAQGNYISINFFDAVFNYFSKGLPSSCGIDGRCHCHYVIESDGSVYPCDFYVLDAYKSGNLCFSTMSEIFNSRITQSFLNEEISLPAMCLSCNYSKVCGGGCKRMKNTVYYGLNRICGYKMFLDKYLDSLIHAVKRRFQ